MSSGALLTEKTPGSARSESCCPSCSKGWSEGCLLSPLKSMWLRLLPTTTLWKGSQWGSMTWSSGSLGGRKVKSSTAPSIPSWDLSLVLRALQQGPFDPLQTVELKFLSDSAPACIGLHQEGRGPARIFGRRFVPRVWAGPGNPEAPAWLCAQGSHYSLQGPGGEPASTALGGGGTTQP